MGAARAYGPKVWKTLMSIASAGNKRLRSDRTLICAAAAGMPCEGQALALRAPRRVFFRSAGACLPRLLPHLGHPDNPGHPASDARAIKVLTDLFCLLRRCSIDIKVFQTFALSSCPSCSSWPSCFRHLNACEGQALALRAAPGPCSSRVPALDLFVIRRSQTTHPVHPANPGHPASDVIEIKVRWTFSACCSDVL